MPLCVEKVRFAEMILQPRQRSWGLVTHPNKCSVGIHIHCLLVLNGRNDGYPHALLATTETDHIFTSTSACGFEKAEVNFLRRTALLCAFGSALAPHTAERSTAGCPVRRLARASAGL